MDSGAIGRMEDIATELSQVDEKEAYYEMVVKYPMLINTEKEVMHGDTTGGC